MKLYAPKYYERFKCIADKCSHSCCIGWEIDVDADTLKKYKSLNAVNSKSILDIMYRITSASSRYFQFSFIECPP